MRVKVFYYGKFKENAGVSEDEVILFGDDDTLLQVLLAIMEKYSRMKNIFGTSQITMGKTFKIKLNGIDVKYFYETIKDGDIIEIIPPSDDNGKS